MMGLSGNLAHAAAGDALGPLRRVRGHREPLPSSSRAWRRRTSWRWTCLWRKRCRNLGIICGRPSTLQVRGRRRSRYGEGEPGRAPGRTMPAEARPHPQPRARLYKHRAEVQPLVEVRDLEDRLVCLTVYRKGARGGPPLAARGGQRCVTRRGASLLTIFSRPF